MTDFTIVNPTKDPFNTGANINQAFLLGIQTVGNPTIGSGTLVTFVPNQLVASGSYSVAGQSGNFTLGVVPAGGDFTVSIAITGSASSNSKTFTGSASQPGSNTVQLTDVTDPSTTVVLSQNNGSWVTDGKIDIDPSWAPITLFIDSNT